MCELNDVRQPSPSTNAARSNGTADGLYIGIADGMSIARVGSSRYSKGPPRRGGPFEYRHDPTRAMDMPSVMPICSCGNMCELNDARQPSPSTNAARLSGRHNYIGP